MLASAEEAEDAVQHTFIQAYDSMRADARELKLKAWLYTIARNRCLSILRARREQAPSSTISPPPASPSEVQQRADLRELLADIRELPEDQRAALVLSEVGDLSHAEIATVVGCEAAKVKSLVFQARSSLHREPQRARDPVPRDPRAAGHGHRRRASARAAAPPPQPCAGCAEFRDDVQRQRAMMAAALPVVPSVAMKQGAFAAVGIGGGAAAAGGGGVAAGGGIASLVASGGAGKAATVLVLAGATVGSGVAISEQIATSPPAREAVPAQETTGGNARDAGAAAGAGAVDRRNGGSATGERRRGEGSARSEGSGPARRGAGRPGKPGGSGGGRAPEHGGRGQGGPPAHAAPPAQGAPFSYGPAPHSQAAPQAEGGAPQAPSGSQGSPQSESTPGTDANGNSLPATSNGGFGGGNSAEQALPERGDRAMNGDRPVSRRRTRRTRPPRPPAPWRARPAPPHTGA